MRAIYPRELSQAIKQIELRHQTEQQEVPKVWYTKAELCRYFGISYNTLKHWERHKHFPLLELQDFCNGRYDIRKIDRFLQSLYELQQ